MPSTGHHELLAHLLFNCYQTYTGYSTLYLHVHKLFFMKSAYELTRAFVFHADKPQTCPSERERCPAVQSTLSFFLLSLSNYFYFISEFVASGAASPAPAPSFIAVEWQPLTLSHPLTFSIDRGGMTDNRWRFQRGKGLQHTYHRHLIVYCFGLRETITVCC